MLRKIREMLKCQKGFTLVELMAVIAIIGILAAIAVPRFASATEDASVAKIQGDLRSLDSAIIMYYSANSSYPDELTDLAPDNGTKYVESVPTPPTGWGDSYGITNNRASLTNNKVTVYADSSKSDIRSAKTSSTSTKSGS